MIARLALLCGIPLSLHAQATIRVEAREVLVDVAVTDRKGASAGNLAARDFAVWEDGRPQKITGVITAGADPETAQKHFVLFFDFETMSLQDQTASQRYALSFIDGMSSPDRYMAVVSLNSSGSRILQNFTTARGALAQAVNLTFSARVATVAAQQLPVLNAPAAGGGNVIPLAVSLRAVAESMAPAPGRKVVLLFTGGYLGTERAATVIRAAIAACNRSNVAVYVIGGHAVGEVTSNMAVSRLPSQSARVGMTGTIQQPIDQFPQRLADSTGGEVLALNEHLPDQMAAVARQQDDYYRVSYVPPASKEGACHTLRVKVNGRGLEAKARNEYCTDKAVDLVAGRIAGQALESRAGAGTVQATMQLPYFYTGTNRASVHLSLEVVPREAVHGQMEVVGIATRADGATAARFADSAGIDVAARTPYHYEHQFTVAAGKYNFQMAIGAGPRAVGKLAMPLRVEPWNAGDFGIGGIAFSTESQPAGVDQGGGPILEGRTPLVAGGRRFVPSATSRFQHSDQLYFYTEVYDPALGAALTMEYRVVDRSTGEVRQDTGMAGVASYVKPGNPLVPFATRLPLAQLPAGAYRLEVLAGHSSGGQTVVRTVDFDLVA